MKTKIKTLTIGLATLLGLSMTAILPNAITADADTNFNVGYADIYESKTKLVCAPTVLEEVHEIEDITFAEDEALPSTVLLQINADLQVVNEQGTSICSLAEAFTKIEKKCAVGIYVDDLAESSALVDYCAKNTAQDVFAVCADKDILKTTVSGYTYLLGILDLRGKTLDYGATVAETNLGMAKIVLADADAYTYEDLRMLKTLQVSVWTEANSEQDAFDLMYQNYTGFLTEDCNVIYGAYEKITKKTLSDTSILIGHRGSSGAYPENSIEACRYAVEKGVDAIEYDIHLTKDNEIVVMHDDDISTTTNGTGKVSEMTLAEIQAYQLIASEGKTVEIPTLEDMLSAFKDDEVVHYIEYKANNAEMVQYVKEIIEASGIQEKVLFISFYADVLKKSQELMPSIPIGQLWGNYDTRDYMGAVETAVKTFYAAGKTNHCAYTLVYNQYINVTRHRGITANGYTFLNDSWLRYFIYNMGSLTIDHPDYIGEMALRVSAADMQTESCIAFQPKGTVNTATKSYEGNCSLIFLGDGAENFEQTENGYVAKEAGEYYAVLSYECNEGYSVLSKTVKITVTASKTEDPAENDGNGEDANENTEETKGCFGSVGLCHGVLFGVGAVALMLKKKKN